MSTVSTATASTRLDRRFVVVAVVLLLAMLMALLDETIVNVGIERLTEVFGVALPTIQWVTGGYLLAVSVAVPFAGWAVDRFGGKRMWIIAVTVFIAGSLLSGLAWSASSLIGFRVVQGLGGGMIIPVVQTLLAKTAGPDRVSKAMGLIAIPLTLGPVLGPVLGGLLLDGIGWRWMFFINLPIGIIALILAVVFVPADEPTENTTSLDVTGLLLLSPGFAAVVYALTTLAHGTLITGATVWVPLLIGVLLTGGYLLHARRTPSPLIGLDLFTNRGFTIAVVIMFLVGGAVNSLLFLTPLYFQTVRDLTALDAGLLLVPQGLLAAVGTVLAGKLGSRLTPRLTSLVGMLLAATGLAAYAIAPTDTSVLLLATATGISGLGLGLTIAPTMGFMYEAIPEASVARATSALFLLNQLGGVAGIALAATLAQASTTLNNAFAATSLIALLAASALALPGRFTRTPPH